MKKKLTMFRNFINFGDNQTFDAKRGEWGKGHKVSVILTLSMGKIDM